MRVDGHMMVPDDLTPGDQTADAKANAADRDLATGRRTCITTYCRASTKCRTDCTWTLNAAAGTVVRRNASCRSQVVLTVIGSWRRIDGYVELELSSIIIVASERRRRPGKCTFLDPHHQWAHHWKTRHQSRSSNPGPNPASLDRRSFRARIAVELTSNGYIPEQASEMYRGESMRVIELVPEASPTCVLLSYCLSPLSCLGRNELGYRVASGML